MPEGLGAFVRRPATEKEGKQGNLEEFFGGLPGIAQARSSALIISDCKG